MTTLADIRLQVQDDLDLEEDDYISKNDVNRWIREGVRQAEAQIHTLYENYFLVETQIPLVVGQNLYDYPTDIFANKIVKIMFSSGQGTGSQTHEVTRVKDLIAAKDIDIKYNDTTNPTLHWLPMNDSGGRKMRIFPANGRAGELNVFYIRNAKDLQLDTDVCDIDEFQHYVVQYAKTQAFLKDGDGRFESSKILEEQFKNDMIETLSNMVPDNNNELDMDLDHYMDSV